MVNEEARLSSISISVALSRLMFPPSKKRSANWDDDVPRSRPESVDAARAEEVSVSSFVPPIPISREVVALISVSQPVPKVAAMSVPLEVVIEPMLIASRVPPAFVVPGGVRLNIAPVVVP